jgi:hypothetical protein
MSDLLGKIKDERGGLEKLISSIPGYKGYKEKEMRREADKLLRETLGRQFEAQWQRLADVQKQLLSSGGILYTDDVEGAATRLRGFIDKLKTASYGYSGFFDAVKIKEEALDKLYEFDEALSSSVGDVAAAIDTLQSAADAQEGIQEAIRALDKLCRQLNVLFKQRKSVLTEQE